MFRIIFHLDFNDLIPSEPLNFFTSFIIPLLTAAIAAFAIFVNNVVSLLNNRKQIKANVITKSRIDWIQDVRQCLYDLNIRSNTLRLKSTGLLIMLPSTNYTQDEKDYLEAYTYLQASIQRLKTYFPIKPKDKEIYSKLYSKYINNKISNQKLEFGLVINDKNEYYSHINIRIMLEMYDREVNNKVNNIINNSKNLVKINLNTTIIYNYGKNINHHQTEYLGFQKISDWITDYLKVEWEDAKKFKK
ncbi:hypothetical protein [Mammaliicoccus sp. J-M39]|uniref:hypothetical protein n=1 Tax=Mammaliicoccus sp. J-M39 TaxID=2898698 RepID=UPI001EFC0189|nr:hypothetical protein [Mammaliicoccus sp. J-M39]